MYRKSIFMFDVLLFVGMKFHTLLLSNELSGVSSQMLLMPAPLRV